jgi:hypothetical protein
MVKSFTCPLRKGSSLTWRARAKDPEMQKPQFRVSASGRAHNGQDSQAQRVISARTTDCYKVFLQFLCLPDVCGWKHKWCHR